MSEQKRRKLLVVVLGLVILIFSVLWFSPVYATDCTVDEFSVSPGRSPQPIGTVLSLHGRGGCNGGIRASRFNIDGTGFGEDAGAPEQNETWTITAGDHTICFEIAGGSNADWSNGARSCTNIRGEALIASCSVDSFSILPSGGTVGTTFTLSGSGSCNTGVRAVRFMIDGVPFGEFGGPSHSTPWNSTDYSIGDHTIGFQVTAGDWSTAATSSTTVTLTDPNAPPVNTPPPKNTLQPSDCKVDSFSISPGRGMPGTVFILAGSGSCDSGVRAIRFMIDGVPFGEFGGPSQSIPWNSLGYSFGGHTIEFQVTSGDWSAAAISSTIVNLTDPNAPPINNPVPPATITSIPPGNELPFWCSNTPPSGRWIYIVASSGMNVRADASVYSGIIGLVNTGMYCQVIATRGEWYQVSSDGRIGWIYGGNGYVQIGDNPTIIPTLAHTPTSLEWCPHAAHAYDLPGDDFLDPVYELRIPRGAWDGNPEHIRIYYTGVRVDNVQYIGQSIVDTIHPAPNTSNDYWVFGISTRWALFHDFWWLDAFWSVEATC